MTNFAQWEEFSSQSETTLCHFGTISIFCVHPLDEKITKHNKFSFCYMWLEKHLNENINKFYLAFKSKTPSFVSVCIPQKQLDFKGRFQ